MFSPFRFATGGRRRLPQSLNCDIQRIWKISSTVILSIYHQLKPHSVRNAIPVATDPAKYRISLISDVKLCWIIMQSRPFKNIGENLSENLYISFSVQIDLIDNVSPEARWTMKKPVTEQDDMQIQAMVISSRNSVITANQLITIAGILCCVFGVVFLGWVSIVVIMATCWVLSIANSIRASNKIRELTGLSHGEQAEIWIKVKAIARKRG